MRGEILDLTGETLTIRLRAGGAPRTFNAADVVEIETPQTPAHVRGLVEYRRHQYAEAETAFIEALNVETRGWVRRDLFALLVRCALRRGDSAAAGTRFIQLIASDRRTRHFDVIPLVWTNEPPSAKLAQAALGWKAEAGDVPQLLAAAALLLHPAHGPSAEETLRELATSTDESIRELAWAQLWRLRLQAGDIGPEELKRWQARTEQMPGDLRGGPWFLIGQAHMARGANDRAATALLWLPLVHNEDHSLASRAGLQAADCLLALGNRAAGENLLREMAARFGHTAFGQEAADRVRSAAATMN